MAHTGYERATFSCYRGKFRRTKPWPLCLEPDVQPLPSFCQCPKSVLILSYVQYLATLCPPIEMWYFRTKLLLDRVWMNKKWVICEPFACPEWAISVPWVSHECAMSKWAMSEPYVGYEWAVSEPWVGPKSTFPTTGQMLDVETGNKIRSLSIVCPCLKYVQSLSNVQSLSTLCPPIKMWYSGD